MKGSRSTEKQRNYCSWHWIFVEIIEIIHYSSICFLIQQKKTINLLKYNPLQNINSTLIQHLPPIYSTICWIIVEIIVEWFHRIVLNIIDIYDVNCWINCWINIEAVICHNWFVRTGRLLNFDIKKPLLFFYDEEYWGHLRRPDQLCGTGNSRRVYFLS